MKLIEIWKRLGKQPLKVTQNTEAIVFVNGEKYTISKVIYENGKFIGFDTKSRFGKEWFNKTIKPEKDKLVIVKDVYGNEYPDYMWLGDGWYDCVTHDDGLYQCWRTDIDVVRWRYQEE